MGQLDTFGARRRARRIEEHGGGVGVHARRRRQAPQHGQRHSSSKGKILEKQASRRQLGRQLIEMMDRQDQIQTGVFNDAGQLFGMK